MNYLTLFICLITLSGFGQTPQKLTWLGKEYYIYPQRQDRNDTEDIIPILNKIPDGDYIVFAEKEYKKHYSKKDTTKVTITFSMVNGKKEGGATWYYKNGKVLQETHYGNDLMEGERNKYFKNGKRSSAENYLNGLLDGKQVSYFRNGKLKYDKNYSKGLLHGSYITYYKKGIIEEQTNYYHDYIEGEYLQYNYKGDLVSRHNYVFGVSHGEFIEYNYNGKIISEKMYENGKVVGISKEYSYNGGLKKQYTLNDTIPLSFPDFSEVYYGSVKSGDYYGNLNGTIRDVKYNIDNNVQYDIGTSRSGKLETFYTNGQLRFRVCFRNGELTYIDTIYHMNGVPHRVFSYELSDTDTSILVKEFDTNNRVVKETKFENTKSSYSKELNYSRSKKEFKKYGKYRTNSYYSNDYYKGVVTLDTFLVGHKFESENGEMWVNKYHKTTHMPFYVLAARYSSDSSIIRKANYTFNEKDSSTTLITSYFDVSGRLNIIDETKYITSGTPIKYFDKQILLLNGKPITGTVEIFNGYNRWGLGYKYKKGVHKIDIAQYYKQGYRNSSFDNREYFFISGELNNGKKTGKWTYEDYYVKLKANYQNDLLSGLVQQQLNTKALKWQMHHIWQLDEYDHDYFTERKLRKELEIPKKNYWYVNNESNYVNGKQEGEIRTYHPNGRIRSVANYRNGLKEGTAFIINIFKDTTELQEYKNGKLHGFIKFYNDKGLEAIVEYKNGIPTGKYKGYINGLLSESGELINGIKFGVWNKYYGDGNLLAEETYQLKDSVYELVISRFKDGGPIMNESVYYPDEVYETIKPYQLSSYTTKSYYKDGTLMAEGSVRDNAEVGVWNYYNESGRLVMQIDVKNNVLGLVNDATVDSVLTFATIKTWYDNGAPNFEGECQSFHFAFDCHKFIDIPEYEVVYQSMWDRDGNQIIINGTGTAITYGNTGLKESEGKIVNGYKNGFWKFWDEEGRLNKVGVYVWDKEDGRWLEGDLEGMRFVDDCVNPFAEIYQYYKDEEVDKTKIINITILHYNKGYLIKSKQFRRNNNDPVKPGKYRISPRYRAKF